MFFLVILDNPSAVNRKSKYSEQPSRLKLKLIFLPQPAHIAIGFDIYLQWNSRPNRLRFIYDKMLVIQRVWIFNNEIRTPSVGFNKPSLIDCEVDHLDHRSSRHEIWRSWFGREQCWLLPSFNVTQWQFDVCMPVYKTMQWQLLSASGLWNCIMALVLMETELACR